MILDDGPVGAALIFRIMKTSGEGSEFYDITVANGAASSEFSLFTDRLVYQPGEHLRIQLQVENPMPGFPQNMRLILYPG